MKDVGLLFSTYSAYHSKGVDALRNNDFITARNNITSAADTLLKIASRSSGVAKARGLRHAKELLEMANEIDKYIAKPSGRRRKRKETEG